MSLPRHPLTLVILALGCTTLHAQTQPEPQITHPAGLEFHARLVSDSHVFHIGEPIEIEISYSSNTVKKYQTSRTNPNPDWGSVQPRVSPSSGVTDLRDRRRDIGRGFGGSILGGGPEFLSEKPITENLNLSFWYRFETPGRYSVVVSSGVVWQIKTSEEGGGRENLALESNPVEFEILPPDPAWQSAEFSNITQALDAAKYPGDRYVAIHRLSALDSPAAVNKLVDLFLLSSPDYSEGSFTYTALRESSRSDLIIPRLQAALTNPMSGVAPQLPELLATLQTQAELGIPHMSAMDPAQEAEREQQLKDRLKTRDKYLTQANAQLLTSIQLRSGPQRAQAIFQAWTDAQILNMTSPQSPASLSQLQQQVFDVERELTPGQRLQLVTSAWQTMPHEQLLPIIRTLTNGTGPEAAFFVHSAFELWCKDWPAECHAEILRRAGESDPLINQHVIYMLPEAEHPELDNFLLEKLAAPPGHTPFAPVSALILRAGSKNLLPSIEKALDHLDPVWKFDCEPQAHLLGYLFRFAPKDAASRLTTIMQSPADPCGNQLLRFLNQSRYSDDLIPIAVAGLNSPNISAAGLSATFLGTRAPESAKAALWLRLEMLWHDWHDRSAQLQSSSYSWGNAPLEQAAMLEQALASALAHATNWKLTPAEHDRLFSGCLTEPCRNIADGKMSMGM
jgi:hypothetical protein